MQFTVTVHFRPGKESFLLQSNMISKVWIEVGILSSSLSSQLNMRTHTYTSKHFLNPPPRPLWTDLELLASLTSDGITLKSCDWQRNSRDTDPRCRVTLVAAKCLYACDFSALTFTMVCVYICLHSVATNIFNICRFLFIFFGCWCCGYPVPPHPQRRFTEASASSRNKHEFSVMSLDPSRGDECFVTHASMCRMSREDDGTPPLPRHRIQTVCVICDSMRQQNHLCVM